MVGKKLERGVGGAVWGQPHGLVRRLQPVLPRGRGQVSEARDGNYKI